MSLYITKERKFEDGVLSYWEYSASGRSGSHRTIDSLARDLAAPSAPYIHFECDTRKGIGYQNDSIGARFTQFGKMTDEEMGELVLKIIEYSEKLKGESND